MPAKKTPEKTADDVTVMLSTGTNFQPVDITLHHAEGHTETITVCGTGHAEKPDGAAKDWEPPFPSEAIVEGPAAQRLIADGWLPELQRAGLSVEAPSAAV